MNRNWTYMPAAVALLATLGLSAFPGAHAQGQVALHHVHGLAYSSDGKQLMVPSHYGLAIYSGGKWVKSPGPQHDYMGFTATREYLYSSGHPAKGSGLANPFGLIRSKDGGKTWDKLGLEGESDFHLLAASWNTNAVYAWNPEPNSRMKQPGLHYTLNHGFQWQRAAAAGLAGDPIALAVHPDDAKTVAVASSAGIHVSRDAGASFRLLARKEQALSAHFDLDGKHLWYGSYAGVPRLTRVELASGAITPVILPAIGNKDAVSYIAQNPKSPQEYAIATFERSVYVTRDGGRMWLQIASKGSSH